MVHVFRWVQKWIDGGFFIREFSQIAYESGFNEILLPTLEPVSVYTDKLGGSEICRQMYVFKDKSDRDLCLRPEGTATCQLAAKSFYKTSRDVKLFYEQRCFRYERPQAGRYREFTQFGIEILNPLKDWRLELIALAKLMVSRATSTYEVNDQVKRGLSYYVGNGFEISCAELGAQKQVCGGGSYPEGIGFAIGVDRLCLVK